MQNLAQQQDAYNRQRCQEFGLAPGTGPYIQCVSQGANAYAAAVGSNPAPPPDVVPVVPLWPVQPQNNSCSAPASTPKGGCQGCSVSCGAQQASCTPGQEWLGGSETCMSPAVCACR
ncbi:MAG: hypothetical protein JSS29_07100 [Proteobacteria bacterium]|nr:hypothetical protein [Pseudomonadota bacterium]